MSNINYGAVPQQLTELGHTLQRQIDVINGLTSTVSSALMNTTWTGPAHDRFEQEWNTTFRTALNRLNQAFDAAGLDCITRSPHLEQVLCAH